MNIRLLLYSYDWLPLIGGIQTVTTALATGLSTRGNSCGDRVASVTLMTDTARDTMDDSKFSFRVIRRPSLLELAREIRSSDIVHIAGPCLRPLLMSRLLGKPTVVEHHGYQAVCPNGLLVFGIERSVCPGYFMARRYGKCLQCNAGDFGWVGSFRGLALTFVRRWLATRANANIAPSGHVGRRVSLPRTNVIFHGVAPTRARRPLDDPTANPTCFGFLGRLVTEKGADVLLQAAHQLSESGHEFRLRIVGDGPERPRLEKMAADLGLGNRTEFMGWVSPEKVNDVLSEVTAVVLPSVWEDVAPLVVLEQMMQGRLVIASDIGGLAETVDGFGLKFPPGDADKLASCMQQVIRNPGAVNELRRRGQEHAIEAYSEDRMVVEHLELYTSLLRNRTSSMNSKPAI